MMRIGIVAGILLVVFAIALLAYVSIYSKGGNGVNTNDSSSDDERTYCQKVIDGFNDRGPLEELTAEDNRCMELMK